jgi:hypothetical protein
MILSKFKSLCGFDRLTIIMAVFATPFAFYFSWIQFNNGLMYEASFLFIAGLLIFFGNLSKLKAKPQKNQQRN